MTNLKGSQMGSGGWAQYPIPNTQYPIRSTRWTGLGVVLLALAACTEQKAPPPALSSADLAECFADGTEDPWRPGADVELTGTPAEWAPLSAGGLVAFGEGIIAYDRHAGSVHLIRSLTEPADSFGRLGQGPGEFASPGNRVLSTPGVEWIDLFQDTLAVLDGREVQLFRTDGTFLSRLRSFDDAAGHMQVSRRVRRVPGGVVLDLEPWEGRRGPGGEVPPRQFDLWAIRNDAERLWSLSLPALPVSRDGGTYHGVNEADPLWDLSGPCFIVSDGATPRLFVGRIDRRGVDTIQIELPPVRTSLPRDDESREMLQQLGVRASTLPAPSARRRVLDMVIDPAGWAWILPVQERLPDGRVTVGRMALRSGHTLTDTVPVFPKTFGAPGVLWGWAAPDSLGDQRLVRVSLRPAR